jgi:hypothetical protein
LAQPDGTIKAGEAHVFAEPLRGTGERHYPWDLMPNSTMTNAAITQQVKKVEGNMLSLKYKDGEKTIVVPSDTTVVNLVPGNKADLKPGHPMVGAHIAAAVRRGDIDKVFNFAQTPPILPRYPFSRFLAPGFLKTPKTGQAPFCRNLPTARPALGLECGVGAQFVQRLQPLRLGHPSHQADTRVITAGRFMLAASPKATGWTPDVKTIGMVEVAALAVTAERSPPVVMSITTARRTRSAASRSYSPSAPRYLIATFRPSTYQRRGGTFLLCCGPARLPGHPAQ